MREDSMEQDDWFEKFELGASVPMSEIADPSEFALLLVALERRLLGYREEDDIVSVLQEQLPLETSFPKCRQIAGRLCSRIVALLLQDDERKTLSSDGRYALELIQNKLLSNYFAKGATLRLFSTPKGL
jgi:hypothetical protein